MTTGKTARITALVVVMLLTVVVGRYSIISLSDGASAAAGSDRAGAVAVLEYDLGDTAFTDAPDWAGKSEIKAVVHYPRRLPSGKMPLVMILHGQNIACDTKAEETWPCPPGVRAFPSYRGYDYLGDALARRGFVVVSLSANGINHHMGIAVQRARLINRHLAMWQQLSATGGGPLDGAFVDAATGRTARVDFRGRVDLTRVGTMGHSVAGEAVMRHASDKHRTDWPQGVQIKAAVPLASRYFELVEGDVSDTLITKIPFAVVSATCWGTGDRQYFDNSRGRNTVPAYLMTLVGGNHNFFNTVWSNASGFANGDDSTCPNDPARPSDKAQRDFAVAFFTAYYERTLKDNKAFDVILTGERPIPGVTTRAEHLTPTW
ncbi:alpha/beta hydrolase [Micromonospora thermarum]|uniref:Alpha/beta hydrolase n=1 Tax=Micromonospora thermarum TaxID=2720024 RepID=A0ABX0Z2A6_9ACTN|nr:alpha/beta hydrolase [Micromonospora thermarum]NJP31946.1 alpha/beta hydrolase [Micromonospora thermarum]